jgi:DNA-binding transcriptional regulator YiaG
MSRTYALVEVSPGAYAEVRAKLEAAGYKQAFHLQDDNQEVLDLHGLALVACQALIPQLVPAAPALSPEHELAAEAIRLRDQQIGATHRACELQLEQALGYASGSLVWQEMLGKVRETRSLVWQEMLGKVRETITQRNDAKERIEELRAQTKPRELTATAEWLPDFIADAGRALRERPGLTYDEYARTLDVSVDRGRKEVEVVVYNAMAKSWPGPPAGMTVVDGAVAAILGNFRPLEPQETVMSESTDSKTPDAVIQERLHQEYDRVPVERHVVMLSHSTEIPPGQRTVIRGSLPYGLISMKPDGFLFAGIDIERWSVLGFRIGDREQLSAARPADIGLHYLFSLLAAGYCDVIHTGMTFDLDVIHHAPCDLPFLGGLVGVCAVAAVALPISLPDGPIAVGMVRGLARAASLLEEDPFCCDSNGEIFDDASRVSLRWARDNGLAPPTRPSGRSRALHDGKGRPNPNDARASFAAAQERQLEDRPVVVEYTLTEEDALKILGSNAKREGGCFRLRVVMGAVDGSAYVRGTNVLGEPTWVELGRKGTGADFALRGLNVDYDLIVAQALRRCAARAIAKVTTTPTASKFDLNPE